MVDFVTEFAAKKDEGKGAAPWMIRMDGSSNQSAGGIEVVL